MKARAQPTSALGTFRFAEPRDVETIEPAGWDAIFPDPPDTFSLTEWPVFGPTGSFSNP